MITRRDFAPMLFAAAVATLLIVTPSHAATAGLTQLGSPEFPQRDYVLTLPAGLTPDLAEIAVSENGDPVTKLVVEPYGDRSKFGVVLVIDTSLSMAGAPIRDAMSAARAFATERPAAQPLGIVTFNGSNSTLLTPTTDADAIDAALASTPPLAAGTHIYDAASAGLDLLRKTGSSAGAVVVLSDGADSGSIATARGVAAAAENASGRIFTIGVQSRSYDGATLNTLATATNGEYLGAATGGKLRSVYRDLGGQLANAYQVRYSSQAAAGTPVRVAVRAEQLTARHRYEAPSLTVAGSGQLHDEAFLTTTPGIVVVVISSLLAVFLLVSNVLAYTAIRPTVRERVDAYGDPRNSPDAAPSSRERAAQRLASSRMAALAESLELAGIGFTPARFLTITVAASVVLAWFLTAVAGTVLLAPAGLLLGGFIARAVVSARVARQRAQFADELPDSLQAVASSMRAGHSFAGGLSVMSEDAGERTAIEFDRVIADERLGISLEDALGETIRRMDNSDLEQVALVAILQRDTGGNGAEALDRVVENLRAREEVRRLVRSLTAQGQLSRWILTALPIVLLLIISIISPGYSDPLWHSTLGNVLVAMGAACIVAGSLVINKIITIKV